MRIEIHKRSPVSASYRSERARGLFNVTEEDGAEFRLEAEIPTEEDGWQVGVIVGPSGSGKSSVGEALVERAGYKEWKGGRWPKDEPIIDAIPGDSFDAVTGTLSTVGLGAVPAWLRPYHVLSNGEKFRAELAQLLMRSNEKSRVVIDEFTSVLDRTVAQVGSAAFVKAWRREEGRRVVLLTPHHDILDWVLPDWVFDTEKRVLYRETEETTNGEAGEYPLVGRLVIKSGARRKR